jgi:hypothetical protein
LVHQHQRGHLGLSLPEGAAAVVALLGLALGLVLGGVAAATDFCTFGGVVDWVRRRDTRRARAWALAAAAATAVAQAAEASGAVALGSTFQRAPSLFWAGALAGGALFGWGMTLTGGCGLRLLVRLGGGSLRALVALLALGLAAYATQRGLVAPLRLWLEAHTSLDLAAQGQGLTDLATAAGLPRRTALPLLAGAVVLGLAGWALADPAFRGSPRHWGSGLGVGLLVGAGWLATGVAGADEFEPQPLRSVSYVAPVGATLAYAMTATGASIDFAVASVVGTALGAVLAFRIGAGYAEGPTGSRELNRHLAGGTLMGIGGVLAGGCTIGQGITGLSTLSLGATLATAAIVAASAAALVHEDRKAQR